MNGVLIQRSFVKLASLTCICDRFMFCHQIKKITTIIDYIPEVKINEKGQKRKLTIYKDCDTMSKTLKRKFTVNSIEITNTSVQKYLYLQYTNLSSSLLESKGIFHNGTPIHFLCSISLCKARKKIMQITPLK